MDSLKNYYGAWALHGGHETAHFRPERQHVISEIESVLQRIAANSRVLDVACGVGFWTEALAKGAQSVLAIDTCQQAICKASTRVTAASIRFRIGDAYRLWEIPEVFDVVFAGFWLSHVPREMLPVFLTDVVARLADGGKIVMLDNSETDRRGRPFCRVDKFGNTFIERIVGETRYELLKNYPTSEEMEREFSRFPGKFMYSKLEHYWLATFQKS